MMRVDQIELEQNFDHYFDRVSNGESFVITVDGKDTVVMIPYDHYQNLIQQANDLPDLT